MAYCAITGESAVGQDYSFCDDTSIHSYYGIDRFYDRYYKDVMDTNFHIVFRSPEDMKGLQMLADQYLGK